MGPGLRRDLILGSITEDGEHWISDVLDIFGEHASLDRRKAGVLEIALDEGGVTPVIEGAPDRDRLGPEAAVRKADDNRRAGAQHAAYLPQHRDRLLQVLDRDADHRGIETGIGERQFRLLV